MGLRSHSVILGYFFLIILTLSAESMPFCASCVCAGVSSCPDLAISSTQSSSIFNTSVIQTPATGALTATYILAVPGSSSAANQVFAVTSVRDYSNKNLAGTVTKQKVVIPPNILSVKDNSVYTGSGGVSNWMCLTEATGFETKDIPSNTSLDLDEDNATRYVRISIHSNDENTDYYEHFILSHSGIASSYTCDCINSGDVFARTVNSKFFYNASCMGQYYITVNFS